jgi:hypothetical protein
LAAVRRGQTGDAALVPGVREEPPPDVTAPHLAELTLIPWAPRCKWWPGASSPPIR